MLDPLDAFFDDFRATHVWVNEEKLQTRCRIFKMTFGEMLEVDKPSLIDASDSLTEWAQKSECQDLETIVEKNAERILDVFDNLDSAIKWCGLL
jgi:hypothetical protein